MQNSFKTSSHMDAGQAKTIATWLEKWIKMSYFDKLIVNIIGGEPLINIDPVWVISDVIKKSKLKSYGFNLITNGILLDENILLSLKELPLKSVQITFDGNQINHDKVKKTSYYNLINVANMLIKNMIKLNIRINYPKGNVEFAMNALEDLGKLIPVKTGICIYFAHIVDDTYLFSQCNVINKDFDNEKILYEKALIMDFSIPNPISSLICLGEADSSFVISPECKVYKCYNGLGVKDADIGYINDGKLIISSYKQLSRITPTRCQNCKYLPICHGGCHLKKNLNNTYDGENCPVQAFNYLESTLLPLYIKQIVRDQFYKSM